MLKYILSFRNRIEKENKERCGTIFSFYPFFGEGITENIERVKCVVLAACSLNENERISPV